MFRCFDCHRYWHDACAASDYAIKNDYNGSCKGWMDDRLPLSKGDIKKLKDMKRKSDKYKKRINK